MHRRAWHFCVGGVAAAASNDAGRLCGRRGLQD
jgi:hypothetical protein